MNEIKKVVNDFKKENGNTYIPQKDMILYILTKVDCIDKKLSDGSGKIAENRANIKTLYWIFGICITLGITLIGIILN